MNQYRFSIFYDLSFNHRRNKKMTNVNNYTKEQREACLLMEKWSGMPTVLERITFFDYIEIEQKR